MFGLGIGELIALAIIVLVVFGGKKIPQLGSGLAKGVLNFKKGLRDEQPKDPAQRDSEPEK